MKGVPYEVSGTGETGNYSGSRTPTGALCVLLVCVVSYASLPCILVLHLLLDPSRLDAGPACTHQGSTIVKTCEQQCFSHCDNTKKGGTPMMHYSTHLLHRTYSKVLPSALFVVPGSSPVAS